jgi:hypothetical protein
MNLNFHSAIFGTSWQSVQTSLVNCDSFSIRRLANTLNLQTCNTIGSALVGFYCCIFAIRGVHLDVHRRQSWVLGCHDLLRFWNGEWGS